MEKGENAGYQHFLLLPQGFQQFPSSGFIKHWKADNTDNYCCSVFVGGAVKSALSDIISAGIISYF